LVALVPDSSAEIATVKFAEALAVALVEVDVVVLAVEVVLLDALA
jgi:hypothetical protein